LLSTELGNGGKRCATSHAENQARQAAVPANNPAAAPQRRCQTSSPIAEIHKLTPS
jgi:hypothetical protein